MKSFKYLALTILSALVTCLGLVMPVLCWYMEYEFNVNVADRLKRAADANTVEIAKEEMTAVVSYLEANNLTSGNTSFLFTRPQNDVKFWYENLSAATHDLKLISPDAQRVERTNTLMKLRETLLDGTEVTLPKYIQYHPNARVLVLMLTCSVGMIIIGCFFALFFYLLWKES